MRPAEEAPHLLAAFRQLDDAGKRGLVRQIMQIAARRGGNEVARLCERMIEKNDFPLQLFAHVAVGYAALDPDLQLGRKRRSSLKVFSEAGADASRRYTAEEKAEWRGIHARDLAHLKARSAAAIIMTRKGLPAAAFETVRKELGKKTG